MDYILGLFEQYDLVILCERAHPEVTQYDMILQLVSDQRFQQQAGHIFTELGTVALNPYMESFLMKDQLSDEQVNEELRYIVRNFDGQTPSPWSKTITFEFLRKLHYLNRSLPKNRKVHVYPTDIEFRWENATKVSRAEYNQQLRQRDKIEADNIIIKFNDIRQAATRNKALVIMNYRHAFPHLKKQPVREREMYGRIPNGGLLRKSGQRDDQFRRSSARFHRCASGHHGVAAR